MNFEKEKKIRLRKNNIFPKSLLIIYICIKNSKESQFQKSYKNKIIIIFHYSVGNFSSSNIVEKGEKENFGETSMRVCAIVHLEGSERQGYLRADSVTAKNRKRQARAVPMSRGGCPMTILRLGRRVSSYVSLSAQYQLGHDAATRETPQKHRCFSSCVLLCSRGPPLAARLSTMDIGIRYVLYSSR